MTGRETKIYSTLLGLFCPSNGPLLPIRQAERPRVSQLSVRRRSKLMQCRGTKQDEEQEDLLTVNNE